jgi:hypothetical protein
MTYRELLEILENYRDACCDEQLDQDVAICDIEGEFYGAVLQKMEEDDVLDAGHLYLDASDWKC